jgi:transcriptional regulator with XRE-family HTH domain
MKKSATMKQLEKIAGESFSFAVLVKGFRTREDLTQDELAKKLGVTKSYISNLENKRDQVTLEQAIKFAAKLGEPIEVWAQVALQDMVTRAGIEAVVDLRKSA